MKWIGIVSHGCAKLKSLEQQFLSFDQKPAIFLWAHVVHICGHLIANIVMNT
jgi:hypothetical protein